MAIVLALYATFFLLITWLLAPHDAHAWPARNMNGRMATMGVSAAALPIFAALAKWCFAKRASYEG
jgi:hypothetical protein